MTVRELIERLSRLNPDLLVTVSDTPEWRSFTPTPLSLVEEEVIDRWWEVGVRGIPPSGPAVVLRGT